MPTDAALTIVDPTTSTRLDPDDTDPHGPKIGRWFWVGPPKDDEASVDDPVDDEVVEADEEPSSEEADNEEADEEADEDEAEEPPKPPAPPWLGCVVHVGSNFARLQGVSGRNQRIHFQHFDARCTFVPDPQTIIDANIAQHRLKVRQLMGDIHALTKLLGVPAASLLSPGADPDDGTRALVAQGQGRTDFKAYETALVEAKDRTLPAMFREIERENKAMAMWMEAALIPLVAEAEALEPVIAKITGTIFKVKLYAGLVEEVVQITDGTPAALHEKIHLFQRRHYMDEECLLNYTAGGMTFKNLDEFDAWLARPENRDRILPFPRCVVAFRIRRRDVDRDAFSLRDFIRIDAEREEDKKTFLYIRNGDQLFCLRTGIEFEAQLFPDLDRQDLNGELWAAVDSNGRVDDLIPQYKHQGLIERKTAHDQLMAGLDGDARWQHHCPDCRIHVEGYEPYAPRSVYYDDITRHIQGMIQQHNQLSLVLQGLLDRSLVLHPHPAWQLYTPEGFAAALTLVFDDSRALVEGEKPDFEAYRAKLNTTLKKGSVTVGQDLAWAMDEAEKENDRRDARGYRSDYSLTTYRPTGNPGPGMVARVQSYSAKNAQVTFEWQRDRQKTKWVRDPAKPGYLKPDESTLAARFTCKPEVLLNIDAYQIGDYKTFFDDPRTRAEYLEWAPLLLVAEDYKAGKRQLGEDESDYRKRRKIED